MGDRLTNKQENYVKERLMGKNQREAYKAAYNAENMSENSIDKEACKLEKNPKVARRLDEYQKEAAKGAVATAQEVLEELTAIGMGTKKYPSYTFTGEEIEKFPSIAQRTNALISLGKHYKLFSEKVDLEGDFTINVVMDEKTKGYAK